MSIADCPGGSKTVSGGNIGAATVSSAALSNCDITIENTETTGIVFSGPVNNVNITIRNIVCTVNTNTDCVKFSSTISNAHNLIFESITDTHTIASGASNVAMVRYVGTVNGVSGTWSHRNSAMKVTSSSGSGGTYVYGILLEDDVASAASIDFSGMSLQSDLSDSTSVVDVRLVNFKKSVTLQGTSSSILTFSNNNLNGSSVSASGYAQFFGVFFGDGAARTYSGISKFIVDGLDMSNSSVTSTTSYAGWEGVHFDGSTTLSMVHDGNVTIKGVVLGGSASAAATNLVLRAAMFHTLSNVNSILVADSGMDFSTGDGAKTTGPSYIFVWSVQFNIAISDIDSITVHNVSIMGKYSVTGSSAYVQLEALRFLSAITNVSKITVSDSTIHPTSASSSQSSVSAFVAFFPNTVSGNSADTSSSALTFNGNIIRGTMTASTAVQSAIAWFHTSAAVTDYNSITANNNVASASMTSSTSNIESYVVYFKGPVTLQGTASSVLAFSNNSMKGSSVSASNGVQLFGLRFGDGTARTYSGISKLIVDGLDMSNSSVTSTTSYAGCDGVNFYTLTTLSMVHDGNITVKGVLLGGSASAAATYLTLYGVVFRTLSNVNSVLVADSTTDFSSGDGATTTTASTSTGAWAVYFISALSDIDSITLRNISILGKYSATGSSAHVDLRVLQMTPTVSNVSKITVTDSTIHPTNASSSQSYVNAIVVVFSNAVSGNSADSNSALTFSGNSIRGTTAASSDVQSAIAWFHDAAAVTDYNSITVNGNAVSASMTSSTSYAYIVRFKNSVTLQGTTSSDLTFSGNSMKGSIISASNGVQLFGLRFGDGTARTYSGISKLIVDGLDMSNSSVTSTTSYAGYDGVYFVTSTTLSMVHDGNITIKAVLLGGSASAAATYLTLHVVVFRTLSNVNSLLVADSQMDFSDGDGAATTTASTYIQAWSVYFVLAISDVDSLTVRNISITGKYSTAGSSAYVNLKVLYLASTATNVSRITVSDSTIHPTDASSSQGDVNSFIANFDNTVSGNSADTSSALTFSGNIIRGTMTASTYVQSAVVWFTNAVTDYNSITANGNAVSASMTSSTSYVEAHVVYFKNSVTLQGTASSVLSLANNSMKGSSVSANTDVYYHGLRFDDGTTRTYSGISKFVVDGLDMSNSSVTCTSNLVDILGVFFYSGSSAISMVHDGNITIKGVQLGGSASAAVSRLGIYVVLFRVLTNVNSILIADSQMDFSSGDGATTTGASTFIQAWSVRFFSALADIDSITLRNNIINGKYSATGSSAYVNLKVLRIDSTVTNVSKITVTDSTIHLTEASSSQSYANVIIANFANTVSGNSADSSSALTFSGNSIRGTMSASSSVHSAIVWFDTIAAVTDYNSITANDNVVSASMTSSTSNIESYVIIFRNSVTFQGTSSSVLAFLNNSMKGSSISASTYVHFIGLRFGDGSTRTYSGISKFIVDGLDMSNSSVTSTTSYVGWEGVYFDVSTTLSMTHDGNITIKGVLLGGSASAAATYLTLYVVVFRTLSNMNSILVADSQTDFSSGDGATTTGASTFIRVWSVDFTSAISDIDSITVRNVSITGKYSATGSSAYVWLEALRFLSAITNVSKITVSDSTIHPTSASSSQSSVSAFVALFENTVSGNIADSSSALTFSGNSIRGTMSASSYVHSAIAWFHTSAAVTDYNIITANDNVVSASMTSSASYAVTYVVIFKNSVTLQGTALSALVFSNNSMKGSSISASTYVHFIGLRFGDGSTRTYSGISKFIVDGLDMSNSSVTSTASSVGWEGVNFYTSTTLSMVHDGNITIKAVQLGGSASAAATSLTLHVVVFRTLSNVNSILVADSQTDFSNDDGATTTGASTYLRVWSVLFTSVISNMDSTTVRNISIMGKYSTAGSGAYVDLRVLQMTPTVSNVSKITVSDSTINPTDASSSQSSVSAFVALFSNAVSGNIADSSSALTFSGNSIRGTMSASSTIQSVIAWFSSVVTDYNSITANDNVLSSSITSSTSTVYVYIVLFANSVTLQGTPSSSITVNNNTIKDLSATVAAFANIIVARFQAALSGVASLSIDNATLSVTSVSTSSSSDAILINLLRLEAAFGDTTLTSFSSKHCAVNVSALSTPGASAVVSEIIALSVTALPSSLSGPKNFVVQNHNLSLPQTVAAPPQTVAAVLRVGPSTTLTDNFEGVIDGNQLSISGAAPTSSWCSSERCSLVRFDSDNSQVKGTWNFTENTIEPNVGSSSAFIASKVGPFTSTTKLFFENNNASLGAGATILSSIGIAGSCCHSVSGASVTFACNHWLNGMHITFNSDYGSTASSVLFTCPATASKTVPPTRTVSQSLTQTKLGLPPMAPTTTFASTFVAVATFPPLPADLTEFPVPSTNPNATTSPAVELDQIDGETNMTNIAAIIAGSGSASTSQPPYTVSISGADPGIGSFIAQDDTLNTLGVSYYIPPGTKENITFTTNNATALAEAIRRGYVYTMSPEAIARNLSASLYVEVVANDGGTKKGRTALPVQNLVINRGPQPLLPTIVVSSEVFNVSRGKKFALEIPAFKHLQHLKMSLGAAQTDMYPIPSNVRFLCNFFGNCSIRGIIEDPEPLSLEVQASDGFIIRAAYMTLNPVTIPLHVDAGVAMQPVLLRPGRAFSYTLPSNLFLSSTEITYDAVTFANGFPLPITIQFDAGSNVLRGTYGQGGVLYLRVKASDLFFTAYRNFTLNFTNIGPRCFGYASFKESLDRYYQQHPELMVTGGFTSTPSSPAVTTPPPSPSTAANSSSTSSQSPVIMPVPALQHFERSVELSQLCSDNDEGDKLQYSIRGFDVPNWLKFDVRPGGLTSLPQTLRLSGTAPLDAEATSLFIINVTVTDSFAETKLALPFSVLPNVPPRRIAFLPNYTIAPGDVETWNLQLSSFFSDRNGDQLTISVTVTEYAETWLESSINNDQLSVILTAKPPDEIAGEKDDAKESDEIVNITVTDPFGQSASGLINVRVRFTFWQKAKTIVYALIALFSTLMSIWSFLYFYPIIWNFFRAGSKTISPCPINAQNPTYVFPEGVALAEIKHRIQKDYCISVRKQTKCISTFMYDELTLEDFPLADPPEWLQKRDRALELVPSRSALDAMVVDPNPKEHDCYVRLFSRRGFIMAQFDVNYEEATKGFVFTAAPDPNASSPTAGGGDGNIDDDDDFRNILGISSPRSGGGGDTTALEAKVNELRRCMEFGDADKDTQLGDVKGEVGAVKGEVGAVKGEVGAVKSEVKNLRDMLQRLLSGAPAALASALPPASPSSVYEPPNIGADADMDIELDDIVVPDAAADDDDVVAPPPEGLELSTSGAYKTKEYDYELERLLEADTIKKEKKEKEKKEALTNNPIHRIRSGTIMPRSGAASASGASGKTVKPKQFTEI